MLLLLKTVSYSHPQRFCRYDTCLSVSRAGEWGRRGVEWPELGGDGDASVEEVSDGVMKVLPLASLPKEDGGTGGPSRATLLTRLSISSALSSVFSFSSWINLRHMDKINEALVDLRYAKHAKNWKELKMEKWPMNTHEKLKDLMFYNICHVM